MNVKSVEKEATRASVTVELTREELEPALNRAYLKYRITGEADISTMPIEYTDATPKYNPTICEELGIQPLDGYEAIEG